MDESRQVDFREWLVGLALRSEPAEGSPRGLGARISPFFVHKQLQSMKRSCEWLFHTFGNETFFVGVPWTAFWRRSDRCQLSSSIPRRGGPLPPEWSDTVRFVFNALDANGV